MYIFDNWNDLIKECIYDQSEVRPSRENVIDYVFIG